MRTIRHAVPQVFSGDWGGGPWVVRTVGPAVPCGAQGCRGRGPTITLEVNGPKVLQTLTPEEISRIRKEHPAVHRTDEWEIKVRETVHDLAVMFDITVPGIYQAQGTS